MQGAFREAVDWLCQISHAVHHAHQRGILHRDLKPANILLDESGKPWLTDFGLAKLVNQETGLTRSSDHLGTPNYMSPEVLRGSSSEASVSGDVWALGVMLWEIVCGEPPFGGSNPMEIMRQIAEDEPGVPRGETVDRDLITLASRCLEKDPTKRIQSASTLAAELGRWLRGEPLRVRKITSAERALKLVRRKPLWAALFAVLITAGVSTFSLWQKAEGAVGSLTHTNSELEKTLAVSKATRLAMDARLHVRIKADRAVLLAEEAVALAEREVGRVLPESEEALYEVLQKVGGWDVSPSGSRVESHSTGFLAGGAHPVRFSPDGNWAMMVDHSDKEKRVAGAVFNLKVAGPAVDRVEICQRPIHEQAECWLPDSKRILMVDDQGSVRVWTPTLSSDSAAEEGASHEPVMIGKLGYSGRIRMAQLSVQPEGQGVKCDLICRESDPVHWVLDSYEIYPDREANKVQRIGAPVIVKGVFEDSHNCWVSPDRRWAITSKEFSLSLSGLQESQTSGEIFLGDDYYFPTFSPDGSRLFLRTGTRVVCEFDLTKPTAELVKLSKRFLFEHDDTVSIIRISPDGKLLAAGGHSDTLMVVHLDRVGDTPKKFKVSGDEIVSLEFSAKGERLAAGTRTGLVTLWPMADLDEGARGQELLGMPSPVMDLGFSPDGCSVIGAGLNSHFRHWRIENDHLGAIPIQLGGNPQRIQDMDTSPDGRWVVVGCGRYNAGARDVGYGKLLDTTGQFPERVLRAHAHSTTGVEISDDGEWLGTTGTDRVARVWRLRDLATAVSSGTATPDPLYTFDMSDTRRRYDRRIAFHPRGSLFVACGDGVLFEWDLSSQNPESTRKMHHIHSRQYLLPDVAISRDGCWMAVARHAWDSEPLLGFRQYGNRVLLFDVSEKGKMELVEVLKANFVEKTTLAFSPDGRWLAAGSAGKGATIWDLDASDIAGSRLVGPVTAYQLRGVGISPDSKTLALAGTDGRLHLWDWMSGNRPRTIHTGASELALTWISGSKLAVGGAKGRVAIWETDISVLRQLAKQVAGRDLSPKERVRFGVSGVRNW